MRHEDVVRLECVHTHLVHVDGLNQCDEDHVSASQIARVYRLGDRVRAAAGKLQAAMQGRGKR